MHVPVASPESAQCHEPCEFAIAVPALLVVLNPVADDLGQLSRQLVTLVSVLDASHAVTASSSASSFSITIAAIVLVSIFPGTPAISPARSLQSTSGSIGASSAISSRMRATCSASA